MTKWIEALEEIQKRMEKRIKMRNKKAKNNMFGKAGCYQITQDKIGVSGKAILHRTKRHRKVGAMHGALGSEAMEVYLNGKF